jgi:hypothetical protein
LKKYEIHVKTSNESGAGTDANVLMNVYGSSGELTNIELKESIESGKNIFETDNLDKFILHKKDVGKVCLLHALLGKNF